MNPEEMNRRISRLENEIAELNKKLSVQIPSEDEKKRRDELFAAFYDYCLKIMRRSIEECLSIKHDNYIEVKNAVTKDDTVDGECNRPDFVVYGDGGKITIQKNGKVTPPSHQHSEELIDFSIDYLKNNKKQGLMKRIGRCMGYLQVAAEIEMMASGADNDAVVLEALLRDFDNTPFKKAPVDWMQPGMTYLKGRI